MDETGTALTIGGLGLLVIAGLFLADRSAPVQTVQVPNPTSSPTPPISPSPVPSPYSCDELCCGPGGPGLTPSGCVFCLNGIGECFCYSPCG